MSTHKAAGGKASQHVSPSGKRLGAKIFSGQKVSAGQILIRQRGTKFSDGAGVKSGRDHTLYAGVSGVVKYATKQGKRVVSIVS